MMSIINFSNAINVELNKYRIDENKKRKVEYKYIIYKYTYSEAHDRNISLR